MFCVRYLLTIEARTSERTLSENGQRVWLSLKENVKKIIVSFKREPKLYIEVYYRIFMSALFRDIF